MSADVIRVCIALAFAIILGAIAFTTRNQPFRRSALGLGAGAMLLLAGYNLGPVYDFNSLPLAWGAMALLVVAMLCYILSWRKGEVKARQQELQRRLAEKIKKRQEATSKRPPSPRA